MRNAREWAKLTTCFVIILAFTNCSSHGPGAASALHEAASPDEGDKSPPHYMNKDQLLATIAGSSAKGGGDREDLSATHPSEETGTSVDVLLRGAMPMSFDLGVAKGAGSERATDQESAGDIDLRAFDTPVRNQGREGLCTAFGTAAAMENMARQSSGEAYNLSERHLWNTYQEYWTPAAIRAASRNYIVPEDVWPYDQQSAPGNIGESGLMKLSQVGDGVSTFQGMLNALARKSPLIIGVATTKPFVGKGGVISVTNPESGMGHAMAVVGAFYDSRFDGGGVLILKNSWGRTFGDDGYVYMPFSYCKHHRCSAWPVQGVDVKGQVPGSITPLPTPGQQGGELQIRVEYGEMRADGYKAFSLRLSGESTALAEVKEVRYHVHETFPDSEYQTVSSGGAFATTPYYTYATGWRTRGAVVTLKSGAQRQLPGVLVDWKP